MKRRVRRSYNKPLARRSPSDIRTLRMTRDANGPLCKSLLPRNIWWN